ncbi:MAG: peptidylprolyl isomerase [Candidatus Cloacimonadota bacterium]|nr:peptidylprolyl isomerase [Candidatus Cloacimonadota bacterium]
MDRKAKIITNYGEIKLELFEKIAPITVNNFVDLAEGKKEWLHPVKHEKVKEKFYDGLIFHRVIPDFMIQGGCPKGDGTGGPGYQFEDECFEKSYEITGTIKQDIDAVTVFNEILVPYIKETPNPDEEIHKLVNHIVDKQSVEKLINTRIEYYKEKTNIDKKVFSLGKIKASVEYGTICMANSGPNTNGSQFFIVTKRDGANWLSGKHTVFGKVTAGMDIVHQIENLPKNAQDRPNDDVTPVIETIEID